MGDFFCSADLCYLPGSALLLPQQPAPGKHEGGNQRLASTESKPHQGIHDTISEEPMPAS